MSLADAVVMRFLEIAVSRIGIRETSRNRGPEIDEWVARLGLDPAGQHPWCVAFLWCMVDDACNEYGIRTPLPRTAKVTRLWQRTPTFYRVTEPRVGALYLHATDPKDPDSTGHIGMVEMLPTADVLVGVEGNSNNTGSREGNAVVRQQRKRTYVNLGYLWLGGPAPTEDKTWPGVPWR